MFTSVVEAYKHSRNRTLVYTQFTGNPSLIPSLLNEKLDKDVACINDLCGLHVRDDCRCIHLCNFGNQFENLLEGLVACCEKLSHFSKNKTTNFKTKMPTTQGHSPKCVGTHCSIRR